MEESCALDTTPAARVTNSVRQAGVHGWRVTTVASTTRPPSVKLALETGTLSESGVVLSMTLNCGWEDLSSKVPSSNRAGSNRWGLIRKRNHLP